MKCTVKIGVCKGTEVPVAVTPENWDTENFVYLVQPFTFDTTVHIEDIQRDFTKLIDFSVQFGQKFDVEKKRILLSIVGDDQKSMIADIGMPSFLILQRHALGVAECDPAVYKCIFLVEWEQVNSDFRAWFADCDFDFNDDFDEIFGLYHTVTHLEEGYTSKIVSHGDRYEISAEKNDRPLIINEEQRIQFSSYIDQLFELGVEGEDALRKAMERND